MGLLNSTLESRWQWFRPRARGSAKRSTEFGKGVVAPHGGTSPHVKIGGTTGEACCRQTEAGGCGTRSGHGSSGVLTDCSALLDCNCITELIREEGRPIVVGPPLEKGIPCRGCLA